MGIVLAKSKCHTGPSCLGSDYSVNDDNSDVVNECSFAKNILCQVDRCVFRDVFRHGLCQFIRWVNIISINASRINKLCDWLQRLIGAMHKYVIFPETKLLDYLYLVVFISSFQSTRLWVTWQKEYKCENNDFMQCKKLLQKRKFRLNVPQLETRIFLKWVLLAVARLVDLR